VTTETGAQSRTASRIAATSRWQPERSRGPLENQQQASQDLRQEDIHRAQSYRRGTKIFWRALGQTTRGRIGPAPMRRKNAPRRSLLHAVQAMIFYLH
jgi:hypothetical protein